MNQISVLISFLKSSITSVYHSVCVWCSVYHLQHSPQRPVCVIGSLFLQWALEGSNFACRDWERGRDSNRKGSREPHTNGCERMVKSLHLQGKAFMALVLLYKGIFFSSSNEQGGPTEFISKYKLCSALTYAGTHVSVKRSNAQRGSNAVSPFPFPDLQQVSLTWQEEVVSQHSALTEQFMFLFHIHDALFILKYKLLTQPKNRGYY